MKTTKPKWKKGDIVCMPQDLQPSGTYVSRGCFVFEAEREPHAENGVWKYGHRDTSEIRLATRDDITKLIQVATSDLIDSCERLTKEIRRLHGLLSQLENK